MATLKDVAALAGVSYTTVSLVLNGKADEHKIPEKTAARIIEAANKLQYTPNVSAKRLKMDAKNRYSIAVFWPADYRTAFVSRTITGIQNAIKSYGSSIDTMICPYQNDQLDKSPMLHGGGFCHGAIVAAPSFADMEYLEAASLLFPLVILNRQSSQHSTVSANNYDAGKKAASYLLAKGFSDIAALLTQNPYPAMLEHQRGFFDALAEYGHSVDNRLYVPNSMRSGYGAAAEILKGPLPRVIFCDSDATARGLLCGFHAAGVAVPRDVAVFAMGAGMPESSDYSVPPLSTVEIPHEILAERGVHLLLRMINKDFTQPCHLIFDAALKVRSSC